jgi:hypothetical protein
VNSRLKEALRRKIAGHNRLVILSTLGGILGVIIMWGLLYLLANWLPLFFLTIVRGLDAEMPANLHRWVLFIFVIWIAAGWLLGKMTAEKTAAPEESAPSIAFRLLMLPPRATLAVWENFRNRIELSEYDLELASDFLERLYRLGKLQMHSVPVELPEDESRDRILTALRSTELIREREIQKMSFLALTHPERIAAFVQA